MRDHHMDMEPRAVIIGAGFAGLAAATTLANKGWKVTVLEKNETAGGRARTWSKDGFTFDLGPSFYWMPDVFERYFARFGRRVSDLYQLKRLDPSYQVVLGDGERIELPAGADAVARLFESLEPGAGEALHRFLAEAWVKYDLGMRDLVYKPSLRWSEYATKEVLGGVLRSRVLISLRRHVRNYFRDERIRQIMEFPVLFLGAPPQRTPALYSLMNYADMALGTWYPMGGMGRVVEAIGTVAREQGADLKMGEPALRIKVENGRVRGVNTISGTYNADVVIAAADYHHVEEHLLEPEHRSYSSSYWDSRTLAPGALLFFIGLDRSIAGLRHHTLFFDRSLDRHSADIYDKPRWPEAPLFYVSCASKTDSSTAPAGCENITVLIPIATGLDDNEATREHYFNMVMDRMQAILGIDLRPHILVQRSYCSKELIADYHSFRGNAYGLASTLRQTGPWRPSIKSRKVGGLYFAGQLTVPGPGVPPALISGQVAADLADHEFHSREERQPKRA